MNFREATDRLTGECVTLDQIAEAAGVSPNSIRRARMDPEGKGYRSPPAGWQKVLGRLARQRSKALAQLAEQLERQK